MAQYSKTYTFNQGSSSQDLGSDRTVTVYANSGTLGNSYDSAEVTLYLSSTSGWSFNVSVTVDGVATGSSSINFGSDAACRGKSFTIPLSNAGNITWSNSSHTLKISSGGNRNLYYKETQTVIVYTNQTESGGGGGSGSGGSGESTSIWASSASMNKSTVTVGESITCEIQSTSDASKHKVRWFIAGTQISYTDIGTATSSVFTVAKSHMTNISNGTSAIISCTVETYSGSNYVGQASTSATITVPDNSEYYPNFSISLNPSNLFNNGTKYVTGLTNPGVRTGTISPGYGSSLTSYSISCTGLSQYSANFSGATSISYIFQSTVTKSGTNTISVTVSDSRGRTTTKSLDFTVYGYSSPKVNSYDTYRCTSNGTADNAGTYIYISMTYALGSTIGGENSITAVKVYTKLSTSSTYTLVYNSSSLGSIIIGPGYANNSTYDIKIEIYDTYIDLYHSGYPVSAYDKVFPYSDKLIDLIGTNARKAIGIAEDVQNNSSYNNAFVVNGNWEIYYKNNTLDNRFLQNSSIAGNQGSVRKIYYMPSGGTKPSSGVAEGSILITPST